METLSVWGEFLGGVGVMLSLIFLGVQGLGHLIG